MRCRIADLTCQAISFGLCYSCSQAKIWVPDTSFSASLVRFQAPRKSFALQNLLADPASWAIFQGAGGASVVVRNPPQKLTTTQGTRWSWRFGKLLSYCARLVAESCSVFVSALSGVMPRTAPLQVPICVFLQWFNNTMAYLAQETLCSMAFADRASRATLGAESAQEAIRPPRCFPSWSSNNFMSLVSRCSGGKPWLQFGICMQCCGWWLGGTWICMDLRMV